MQRTKYCTVSVFQNNRCVADAVRCSGQSTALYMCFKITGVLLTLSDAADKVLHRLAQLLAEWWLRRLPDWTEIATNTFLYFLRRSVAKETVNWLHVFLSFTFVVNVGSVSFFLTGSLRCLLI